MRIKLLNADSDNCHIRIGHFFRDTMNFFADCYNDNAITWGSDGKILAITHLDFESTLDDIPWEDINIICAETCQQIYDNQYRLDNTKSYIFLTESWVDFDHLKEKFYGIPLIAHYCVFNEVLNYGSELFQARSHLSLLTDIPKDAAEYDFFCLIGRKTKLRSNFMFNLSKLDISKSLVKYNGQLVTGSGAPENFDRLDYSTGFYDGATVHHGMTSPPKLVQEALYKNFKFEIQFETDSSLGNGWDLVEYHVTEKTIKPLIIGKPCLMFGPVGYHAWLNNFGIDLGHDNFNVEYDSVANDSARASAMINYIKTVDIDSVVYNLDCHDKNMLGFLKLCYQSKAACVEMYKKIKLVCS